MGNRVLLHGDSSQRQQLDARLINTRSNFFQQAFFAKGVEVSVGGAAGRVDMLADLLDGQSGSIGTEEQ